MRKIRYQVAASLDGYIAGPDGEYDWIPMDPDIDFGEIFATYDTLLMGRRTYEALAAEGGDPFREKEVLVFSRSLIDMGQVDEVGVAVVPILLGEGIPLLVPGDGRHRLRLVGHRVYPETGIVSLEYELVRSST